MCPGTIERLDAPADFFIPPFSLGETGCFHLPRAKEVILSEAKPSVVFVLEAPKRKEKAASSGARPTIAHSGEVVNVIVHIDRKKNQITVGK